jgi:hypothetical protein
MKAWILYFIATIALGGLFAAYRRLKARVALDEADRTLREEMPDWK